jgi:hypothetical protein
MVQVRRSEVIVVEYLKKKEKKRAEIKRILKSYAIHQITAMFAS